MTHDVNRISPVLTDGRFKPGNPGKPKGARNRATRLLEAFFDGEADEVAQKAVAMAKKGRVDAIRLVLDRACPARKHRFVEGLALPPIKTASDAVAAMGAITAAVADGVLTIPEAHDLADIVDIFRRVHELADLERRVVVLEREAAHGVGEAG